MKHAIAWIKGNPITVASIIVVLLSLGFLVWVHRQGAALEAEMAQRQQVANNITGLTSRTLELPSTDPDAPPDMKTGITVNPWVIETVTEVYDKIGTEYTKIREQVVSINQEGHVPLVENLFPDTDRVADLPFVAQEQYLRSFEVMLSDPAEEAEGGPSLATLPRLDAGLPPMQEEITAAVARVDYEFRNAPGMVGQQLTPDEQQTLFKEQRDRALEILLNRGGSLHLYADPNIDSPDFPFDVLPWARSNERPKPYQLWEGQIELWIQQDIAQAIALTNGTGEEGTSVLTAPIKRLVKIDVLPGYVGLHTLGGLTPDQPRMIGQDGLYAAPAALTGSPDRRLPDNFYASPTGRVSNALYDVRHARVSVLIDVRRLPEFFNALSEVNFMTVLKVDLEDVDEYQALQEGYVYGEGDDVVRADVLVESVWLRDWTQQYMPSLVQQYLGLTDPTELNALGQPSGGMEMYPGMGPGGYGDPYGGYGGYADPYAAPPQP